MGADPSKMSNEKPYKLHRGAWLDIAAGMHDSSVDAIVVDPPYHLKANKKDDPRRASPDATQRDAGWHLRGDDPRAM